MGARTRGSDIEVNSAMPYVASANIDMTGTTAILNAAFGIRMAVKSMVVVCVTAVNVDGDILFGIVGDTDEFLTGGVTFTTAFTAGETQEVAFTFTDQYLEVGEVLNVVADGVPIAGSYYVTVMLEPAPAA